MTWNTISVKQFNNLEGKTAEEALYELAENMTITEFKNTDWSFLKEPPKPEKLKEKYTIDNIERIPNVDPRSWSVEQYLQFINGDYNGKLNTIFGTKGVNYDNMSIVDYQSVMFFFALELKTCIRVFQKYLNKQKIPKEMKELLQKELKALESLAFCAM